MILAAFREEFLVAAASLWSSTLLLSVSKEPSIWCVWFRVICHGNGGPGQELIGLAVEGAGGCLLIL